MTKAEAELIVECIVDITRNFEERRDSAGTDWCPESLEEAEERCVLRLTGKLRKSKAAPIEAPPELPELDLDNIETERMTGVDVIAKATAAYRQHTVLKGGYITRFQAEGTLAGVVVHVDYALPKTALEAL